METENLGFKNKLDIMKYKHEALKATLKRCPNADFKSLVGVCNYLFHELSRIINERHD